MKILVTGGSGFVGSALVRRLVAERCGDVSVLDKEMNEIRLGSVKNRIVFARGNILDPSSYQASIERIRPDVVYHLAWYAEPGKYLTSLENLEHLKAGIDLIKFLYELKTGKVIVAGTCFEYDTRIGRLSESSPEKPGHIYSGCKLALKTVGERLSSHYGFPFIWARLFYLYGPYEHPQRLVPMVLDSLRRGERFVSRTHGLQLRDYMHIDDVAKGLICLMKEEKTSTYNIGSGEPVSVRDLVTRIADAFGRRDLVSFAPDSTPLDEPMEVSADITKLKALGFAPGHDIESYVKEVTSA